MKITKFILSLVLILCFLIILLFSTLKFYNTEILSFFLNMGNSNYFFLYLLFSILFFLSPLPITFIVLLNGYLFGNVGFVYSLILTLFGSSALYLLSYKINDYLKINLNNIFKQKKINLRKITQNKYSIFFSRFFIPYFIHNIYYGIQRTKFSKFIIYVFFAEIPLIFSLNSVGNSLNFFSTNSELSFLDLILNKDFYIPLLVILLLILSTSYIKSKFVNKL